MDSFVLAKTTGAFWGKYSNFFSIIKKQEKIKIVLFLIKRTFLWVGWGLLWNFGMKNLQILNSKVLHDNSHSIFEICSAIIITFNVNICSMNRWWINQETKYMLLERLFCAWFIYKKNFHHHEGKKIWEFNWKKFQKKFVAKEKLHEI